MRVSSGGTQFGRSPHYVCIERDAMGARDIFLFRMRVEELAHAVYSSIFY